MLTKEDIQLIIEAEKELFYSKSEMDGKFDKIERSFATLQTSVDGLAAIFKKYYDEQTIITHRLSRVEDWIKKVSDKLGVKFEV